MGIFLVVVALLGKLEYLSDKIKQKMLSLKKTGYLFLNKNQFFFVCKKLKQSNYSFRQIIIEIRVTETTIIQT